MKPKNIFSFLILAIVLGLLSGAIAAYIVVNLQSPGKEDLMRDFYLSENYVHVSPHGLRKHMAKGDAEFILVDLRSQEEYEQEHIAGAINIPAYKDPDTSAYWDVERIVGEFSKLPKDVDIIVYCYSIPCMTGRKIGKMLAEHGIYVKQLGIGWNEWRYHWELWNHEHEWNQTTVEDYIASGPEPGSVPGVEASGCSIEGAFGC
jgi:rhodanese-related sulfurtransferase